MNANGEVFVNRKCCKSCENTVKSWKCISFTFSKATSGLWRMTTFWSYTFKPHRVSVEHMDCLYLAYATIHTFFVLYKCQYACCTCHSFTTYNKTCFCQIVPGRDVTVLENTGIAIIVFLCFFYFFKRKVHISPQPLVNTSSRSMFLKTTLSTCATYCKSMLTELPSVNINK